MIGINISKNHYNLFFEEIKQIFFFNPLDLNGDKFDNGTQIHGKIQPSMYMLKPSVANQIGKK